MLLGAGIGNGQPPCTQLYATVAEPSICELPDHDVLPHTMQLVSVAVL
jgi:hypothetical protein